MTKFDTINVIPFIDIMLVLLAIVLTTATFISNGQLDIALPESGADVQAQEMQTIEIAIDRLAKLYLEGVEIDLDSLNQKIRLFPEDVQITLMIDETVEFKHFVMIIDLLKEQSLERISILTRKSS